MGLGLAACQKGYSVAFTTAAALVHELMEARDERRLRALQKQLSMVILAKQVDIRGMTRPTAARGRFALMSDMPHLKARRKRNSFPASHS